MNTRHISSRLALVACAAALGLASCGGSPDSAAVSTTRTTEVSTTSGAVNTNVRPTTTSTTTTTTTTTTAATSSTAASGTTPDTEPAPTTSTAAVTELPAPPTTLAPPLVEGLAQITLVQPAAGAAVTTPQFEWQPVAGAAEYRLVVGSPAGPVWAWEGGATTVRLGGLAGERPVSFGGPQLVAGSTWSVVALDGAGTVIAVSELRQVGPA